MAWFATSDVTAAELRFKAADGERWQRVHTSHQIHWTHAVRQSGAHTVRACTCASVNVSVGGWAWMLAGRVWLATTGVTAAEL
jgi:hypothetical protein